ncbi:MAG TPA: MBL fold metallo-hydrolase, partial [Solirubrobacteraceae bacterium]|nr:MBL fold metallo-hydrolase [Solirubrobacteraceae bacterium]
MSAEIIDLRYGGRTGALGAWVDGETLIDCGPSACLPALLQGLGERRPERLLLTHIHFDHAGAAGALLAHWPELPVFVHPRGAPHLIDPSRLVASARRVFAFGREPVFVREGGSIGAVVDMEKVLRCPVLFLGLSLPEHGYHAPNENYDWQQASGGMVAF